MTWSLTFAAPREPELLELFFCATGKSLFLSNAFESKCSSLLRILKVDRAFTESNDVSAALILGESLRKSMLGETIRGLKEFPAISDSNIEEIDKAREARNHIAHQGADIGALTATAYQIIVCIEKLRTAVSAIAAADNLVSYWLFRIEDLENGSLIHYHYPQWIDRWVFGELNVFLKSYQPKRKTGTRVDQAKQMLAEPIVFPEYIVE